MSDGWSNNWLHSVARARRCCVGRRQRIFEEVDKSQKRTTERENNTE